MVLEMGTLGLIKRPLDVEKLSYKSFKGFNKTRRNIFRTNSKGKPFRFLQNGKIHRCY